MAGVTLVLSGLLVVVVLALLARPRRRPVRRGRQPPGPSPWPLLGDLHLLRHHDVPYKGLSQLRTTFGDVFRLQLGVVPTLVVHGIDNIKQILTTKAASFDARPNFNRYHRLFGGNKENSLAFCDWSEVHRKRRTLLNDHTFPKTYTNNMQRLNSVVCEQVNWLLDEIADASNNNSNTNEKTQMNNKAEFNTTVSSNNFRKLIKNKHVATLIRLPSLPQILTKSYPTVAAQEPTFDLKKQLSITCCNIFLRYFCSSNVDSKDPSYCKFVDDFDKVFFEINQGYAYDFLPFLQMFYKKDIRRVEEYSASIREFVLKRLVEHKLNTLERTSATGDQEDLLSCVLRNVKFGDDVQLELESALFMLEDIIGGHSAISNFLVKVLTLVVGEPEVQEKVRLEVAALGKDITTLNDRTNLPYTECVVLEGLRLISSPIVPHVTNQDTHIFGYDVPKDTLVLLNNHELNMSEQLWLDPTRFNPARFLDPVTGLKTQPGHFVPFGGGRRSCMGYKLVQLVSVAFLSNLLARYKVLPLDGQDYTSCPMGNLALPSDTFRFRFELR